MHSKREQWAKWITRAKYWYTSTFRSALCRSPYEVLYGRQPCHFAIDNASLPGNTDVEEWLHARVIMAPLIRQHLEQAQQRMKHPADKHHSERQFAVGDYVYLRLQPYVQSSVEKKTSQKLGFKIFGPYLILQCVGPVAYKLQLPAASRIHPVVHVSQLKKGPKPNEESSTTMSLSLLQAAIYPNEVLEEHYVCKGANWCRNSRCIGAGCRVGAPPGRTCTPSSTITHRHWLGVKPSLEEGVMSRHSCYQQLSGHKIRWPIIRCCTKPTSPSPRRQLLLTLPRQREETINELNIYQFLAEVLSSSFSKPACSRFCSCVT